MTWDDDWKDESDPWLRSDAAAGDDDDEEPVPSLQRYRAVLAPEAENDFLAIPPGRERQAFFDLFQGAERGLVQETLDIDVEDEPLEDPDGWSGLRVGGRVAYYLRLTNSQRTKLRTEADILVLRIWKLSWIPA